MDMHRARATTGRKLQELSALLETLSAPIAGADDLYEARLVEGELGTRLSAALDHLNPRYKRAIELRFLEEQSREDCATSLAVKVGTFDVLILRALRALGKRFRGDGAEADE
jgi:RNA polymerase sigma-70 factor (ECF subfamily)